MCSTHYVGAQAKTVFPNCRHTAEKSLCQCEIERSRTLKKHVCNKLSGCCVTYSFRDSTQVSWPRPHVLRKGKTGTENGIVINVTIAISSIFIVVVINKIIKGDNWIQ